MTRARRLLVCAGILAGCGGGRAAADVAWTTEQPKETRPLRETEYLSEGPATLTDADGGTRAPLGVRPDVRIAKDAAPTAQCACLDVVVVSKPSDFHLAWHAAVPEVTDDALAIAISSRGVECPGGPADDAKRRASISAVDREGDDVIVEVEELPDGRPIALGAIIPKPTEGGNVYIRPRNKDVPYGRVPPNSRLCKVH